ncbi:Hydratase/decarboxylase [plant metagenome]
MAHAACPSDAAVAAYFEDYKAARESQGLGDDLTLEEARCSREKLARLLQAELGTPVGYKAAFTNPAIWERFKVKGPEWAYMFGKHMYPSGTTVSPKIGANLLFEADMVAVVKDAGLATAETPLQALQHISHFVPFIEMPDAMRATAGAGPALVATNIIFRGGVLGSRIDVQPTQAFLDSLADTTMVMTEDKSGKELARAKGSALMGNPAASALWLAKALREAGIAVKPGDLLSLGSFNVPVPPEPGTTVSVRFQGLPNTPSATVNFQ